MNQLQFSININASKARVWEIMWNDASFRDWAGIIDEGTYMKGDLEEGGEVEFISAVNGYGVTSLVEKLIPNELLVLRHAADTQQFGEQERKQEWTGGQETYILKEVNGVTTLTAVFDVPEEMEQYFKDVYPKAFDRVKVLAEVV